MSDKLVAMSRIRKVMRTAKNIAAGAALGGFGGLVLSGTEAAKSSDRERLAHLSKAHSTFITLAGATAKMFNRLKSTGQRSNPGDVQEMINDIRDIWTGDEVWGVEDELDDSPPNDRDIVN